ncbi:hypothetical protein [Sphingomonas sp. G-3-2-10]|uniref:hypothetical protein n=1 Tax=Sphingomonas sp. G-3-2-10 TaxID=2728838 RepID=UPI00146B5C38|nr:hypothetical protein [Sphingomonas sp. G-3-2-10]NML07647.1 hypothetical protein [Sphingomonas sp. G-3-2-10]
MGAGRPNLNSPFKRLWRELPIDGRGFLQPGDADARRLHRWATRRIWGRIPWPLRPFGILVARILWCAKALPLARAFAGRNRIGRGRTIRLFADACLTGMPPWEAYCWRYLLVAPARPLSSRALSKTLAALAVEDQRKLLGDKIATVEALSTAGIRFPKQVALIPRGAAVRSLPPGPDALFAKPRHGAASRFTLALDRLDDGAWRINGTDRDAGFVAALLELALRNDDLIVQERLTAAPELAEFATLRPPVLRIHTLRGPQGGVPMIHSAVLSTSVPREVSIGARPNSRIIPVAIDSGEMQFGFRFPEPLARASGWSGKPVPGYEEARRMALACAAMFDGLPMVAWEFILTPGGPVMLEGNSEPGHHYIGLAASAQTDTPSLFPLLARWLPEA